MNAPSQSRLLFLVALVAGIASQTACKAKPAGILLVIRTPQPGLDGAELHVFAGSIVEVRYALGIQNPTVLHDELEDADIVSIESGEFPSEPFRYFIEADPARAFLDVAVRMQSIDGDSDWVALLPDLALESGVVREWEVTLAEASICCLAFRVQARAAITECR